jgi:hypothetical protein
MFQPLELKSKRRDREIVPTNKGIKLMRQLNARMLFVCFAALLFVFACADTSKKEAEEAAPAQTVEEAAPAQTVEEAAPAQTAEATVEEVTLTVTGMT